MHRVLFVNHCADWGGIAMNLLALVERLDRTRYEPAILFNTIPGEAITRFEAMGIRTFREPSIGTYAHAQGAYLSLRSLRPWEVATRAMAIPSGARRFEAFLKERPHDLVHLNSVVQVPAAIGAKRAGVPIVWHVHEELHPGFLGLRRTLVRRCVDRCADRVVAISQHSASTLTPSPRIRIIYNPVDFNRFDSRITRAEARSRLGLAAETPIVLMLGGVVPHKGADVLVSAAVDLRRAVPDVLVLIAGHPPTGATSPSKVKRVLRRAIESSGLLPNVERRVLATMVSQGLRDTVRFLGMRHDVPDLLAAADVLVWPATVPHFARPVVEAGAMGRPVIASDFPASREIVEPGVSGVLVRPGDPAALAHAIIGLLGDPELGGRMGGAGRSLARARCDADAGARAMMEVYEEVLASHPPDTPSGTER